MTTHSSTIRMTPFQAEVFLRLVRVDWAKRKSADLDLLIETLEARQTDPVKVSSWPWHFCEPVERAFGIDQDSQDRRVILDARWRYGAALSDGGQPTDLEALADIWCQALDSI